jgi:rhamnogalacturonan endolyase
MKRSMNPLHAIVTLSTCLVLLLGHALHAEVVLTDADDHVVLDNGLISMVVLKHDSSIRSIKKDGVELLEIRPGNSGRAYVQRYAKRSMAGVKVDEFRVDVQTPDMVDIAFYDEYDDLYPFEFENHYVMRDGVSGFYNYMIVRYDPAKTERAEIAQTNICLRMDDRVFTHAQVSDDRVGPIVVVHESGTKSSSMNPESLLGEKVMDATYRLPNGDVYTKYDWCVEEARHRLHGIMGNGIGAWIIQGTGEHLNGGPTTQELTTHNAILLRHFNAAHFGSDTIKFDAALDGPWEKLGGPWFVYINTGPDNAALWDDAKKTANRYLESWPLKWLDHPLYPLNRGAVAGRLSITDGTDPEGTMVLLAQPEGGANPKWQTQGKDYMFWAWVQADGSFKIDKVRPGTYSLYALSDDQMGEFQHDGIVVVPDQTTDAGRLVWEPDIRGQVLWQIGIPDRTAKEYLLGDGPRRWGRWLKYSEYFPNDVEFTIGTSQEAEDWFYVHSAVQQADGTWRLPTWRVRFNCERAYAGKAYLRLGIAGVSSHAKEGADSLGKKTSARDRWAAVALRLNGTELQEAYFPGNDSASTRSGVHGRYREALIPFDASLLHEGVNELELTLAAPPPEGILHNFPYVQIMYDCLRLEVDPDTPVPTPAAQ